MPLSQFAGRVPPSGTYEAVRTRSISSAWTHLGKQPTDRRTSRITPSPRHVVEEWCIGWSASRLARTEVVLDDIWKLSEHCYHFGEQSQ